VGRQVLGRAQGGDGGGDLGQGGPVELGHLDRAQEGQGGEAAAESGRAGRRQHVVGAGRVVAKRDGRVRPHEHGARVDDPAGQLGRALAQQLQVLGGERLDHAQAGVGVVAQDDGRLAGQGLLDPLAVAGGRDLLGQDGLDRGPHGRVGRDQQAGGQRVVLGLGDQVGGHRARVGAGVGHDRDLGRAGEGVGADPGRDLLLGQGDVQVARPGDRVHGRDGLGPVSQGCHGLGSPDQPDLVHAEQGGGPEHGRVAVPGRPGRGGQGDLADPGRLGRDHVHDHTGRVGAEPTGDVHPGPAQRHPAEAEPHPAAVGEGLVGRPLGLVEGAHPADRVDQGGTQAGDQGAFGGGQLVGRRPPGGRRRVDPVQTPCRLGHGGVPLGRDVGDQRPDRGPGLVHVGGGRPRQQPGRVAVQPPQVEHAQHEGRSERFGGWPGSPY
jgi:hypothetical protein